MNEIRDVFQRNLIRLMEKHDLSQKDLAVALGVSKTTVNNWVLGYNVPKMDRIDVLCKFFNVTRTELLGANGKELCAQSKFTTPSTNNPDRDWVYKKLPSMTDEQVKKMRKLFELIDDELETE